MMPENLHHLCCKQEFVTGIANDGFIAWRGADWRDGLGEAHNVRTKEKGRVHDPPFCIDLLVARSIRHSRSRRRTMSAYREPPIGGRGSQETE